MLGFTPLLPSVLLEDDGCMGAKERWKGYNINHRKVSAAVDEEGGSRGRKRRQ